jgi:hypothetical protein
MFKRLPTLIFFLVAVYPASGQVTGAVIVNQNYDAAKNLVTLHMLNQTDKDISAYSVTVKATVGGRVYEHQVGQEMLGLILALTDPTDPVHDWFVAHPPPSDRTWPARTTHDYDVGVSPGATVEATLNTVIYMDRTAETSDPDELNRLLTMRKVYATQLETGSKAIHDALANPDDPAPHETARRKLQAGEVSQDLENAPKVVEHSGKAMRDYLNDLITEKTHRAQLMRQHAEITVVGGAK